ncbi:MAG: DUF2231 domain-containing protein [Candidatus Binataceae bacterium]
MNSAFATVQHWHVHPVADHFTIALLIVGVILDLFGSLFFGFRWIRYAALTLMILGTISIAISWESGGWEAHRVHELVTGPSKSILHYHAELGDWLIWIFVAIAVCRILIEIFRFAAEWRPIYLIAAVLAVCLLGYQGYLGGELVYTYGVGTALLRSLPVSTPQAPTPVPTVYVPPSPTPAAAPTASPLATPSESPNPKTSPTPSTSPRATPTPSSV